ncbi:calcium-binding protein [Streptomyces sp. NPDC013457]|uniref:calcium-binding protein n=1 Tax=Streptomyces sp. NPDC013457 TaxID=3364866 RepID=UPI0037016A7E
MSTINRGRGRPRGAAALVTGLALSLVLSLPGVAAAAPGDLDPSFDGDGRVVTDVSGYESGGGVVIQPDGKIVSVGTASFDATSSDFVVLRHNADGSLDTTFDGDGIVTTDFQDSGNDEGRALALQPDGKIVAVGGTANFSGNGAWTAARYNPDGSLDTTFGEGGKVVTEIDPSAIETALAVVVQSDGKIVAGGGSFDRWALVRYNADGTPDTTFDGDGIIATDPGAVSSLALQSDNKIIAAGHRNAPGFTLHRYNTDGSLDTAFDGDGRLTSGFGAGVSDVVLQPDGRIVAAGNAGGVGNAFAVARFSTTGALDPTFDGDGTVTTSFGPESLFVQGVALQSDGRIVAAGQYAGDFALVRYNTGGSLDTDFGGDGRVTTDFGTAQDNAASVAVQGDGRIVAAGSVGSAGDAASDRALARYLGGGGSEPPPTVDVSVTKTGPATISLGDAATYTIRVTNHSTTTTAGVSISDTLTGGSGTILSATPSQGGPCTVSPTTMNCSLGNIAPGASATVTVVAEPRATGTLTDWVAVGSVQQDPNQANNNANFSTTVNNARGCTIVGTSATETINGTSAGDVICALSGNDTVYGHGGNDTIYGGAGNDYISGGTGTDRLFGQGGNDWLAGEGGNDNLNSQDGVGANDAVDGGAGIDTCTTDANDYRYNCP